MNKKAVNPLVRIVDDEAGVRKALAFLLETEGWEVNAYGCARDFLVNDHPSRIGCLILDVSMPEMNGLELYEEMKQRGYEMPVIFLTGHGDVDMAVQAMKDGAVDFLQKPMNEDRLIKAVAHAIAWDENHRGWTMDPREEKKRFESLTNREKQIIQLVASGLINKEIAERLGLSERTVEVHRQNAAKKLNVQSVSEIARLISHIKETK